MQSCFAPSQRAGRSLQETAAEAPAQHIILRKYAAFPLQQRRFANRFHKQNTRSIAVSQQRAVDSVSTLDPEARYRQYGKDFGSRYSLDLGEFMDAAPRVKYRNLNDRQKQQLAELALVNERLAGRHSWAARLKLEHLRSRRKNWALIYEHVTKHDAAATFAAIEEANMKVQTLLSEQLQETKSVTELNAQLVQLNDEVQRAHARLHLTQSRVQHNLQRVEALKTQAEALERLQQQTATASSSTSAQLATSAAVVEQATASSQSNSIPSVSARPVVADRSPRKPAQRNRGLQSGLQLEEGLRNHWFPAAFSSRLQLDTLLPFELFGEAWVLFRDSNGVAACVRDECAHRACPLSLGTNCNGKIQCPYHGWEYQGNGECVSMPSTAFCRGISIRSLACSERDGFLWVWPGEELAPTEIPAPPQLASPPAGYSVHAEIEVEVPVEHGLLLENLLDLAHAPFTHTTTFARGWPVPDFVSFQASRLLSGKWDPYPIDMSFEPPCCVLSTIGLAQPGKIERGAQAGDCQKHLHQLHVCLPSKPGHTRLLYRMSLDFMHWVKYIPGIQQFWVHIAGQVLGEDLVLVKGQQERMLQGSDTWAHPVSYDKLAVRYRRWRNTLDSSDAFERQRAEAALTESMSAGDIFRIDDDDLGACQAEGSCVA